MRPGLDGREGGLGTYFGLARSQNTRGHLLGHVTDITDIKVDGMNVIFTLKAGNADFPFVLSDYHLPILPAKDGKIDPNTMDGCGPYKIDSIEFGVGAVIALVGRANPTPPPAVSETPPPAPPEADPAPRRPRDARAPVLPAVPDRARAPRRSRSGQKPN